MVVALTAVSVFRHTADVPSHTSGAAMLRRKRSFDRLVRTARRAIRATPLSEDPQ